MLRRRRRYPGRIDLPRHVTGGNLTQLRSALFKGQNRSALDAIEARERAEQAAREPGRPHFALRISVITVLIALCFSVLVIRLWSIQVIQVQSYRKNAIQTTTRNVPTAAPRGRILASDGQVLAGDTAELVVTLKTVIDANTNPPTRVASTRAEQNLVALIPGLTLAHIRSQLNNEQYGPYQPVPVAEGISQGAATTIEESPGDFPGAAVSKQYVRDYPQGALAAQMVGYLGPITCPSGNNATQCTQILKGYERRGYQPTDLMGTTGLEAQYEAALRGKDGIEQVQVDASGNPIGITGVTPPTQGNDVVLNLNVSLEKVLTNALNNQMACLRSDCKGGGAVPADWGAAVVMKANTGAVLAIASVPSYNNNEWVGGISQTNYKALQDQPGNPLIDYALAGTQPPGSTFKLATATAALDDGLVSPYTIINDPGYFNLSPTQTLHDAAGESFGPIAITKAISVSSDVFFYTLGAWFYQDRAKYGMTPIQNMAARYGYGQNTGIDLPGQSYGWVDSPQIRKELHTQYPSVYADTWYLGDNVEMAFGQGETLITPLEQAVAYSTFANGGTRYAPEMAAGIVGPNGKLVRRIAPKVEGHVPLPPSTYSAMLAGFEGAVQQSDGTAYADFIGFNFNRWLLAGKTGTADVAPGSTKQPTAWFVAFGGPKSSPARYVVAVEIDQAGYGADASAPVARQVFNYLYRHNGVPAPVLSSGS